MERNSGKKRKADEAHRRTDKKLAELEKRICREYKEAARRAVRKNQGYFERLKERDACAGGNAPERRDTKAEYISGGFGQIGRGKRSRLSGTVSRSV